MCGIAGVVFDESRCIPGVLGRKLQQRIAHRGPDDLGYLLFRGESVEVGRAWPDEGRAGQLLLVHRRLSIIDLGETGWQPMGTEDGRHYIVYNGEIYNYLELREELEALGHRFHSHSDTEVLLAAYVRWGGAALQRLVGMFAFAILDTWKRTLFLARDFFGIKPLFYTASAGGFAFASEIKALLDLPGVGREPNPRRVYEYLSRGITDHGSETMYRDIRQLPAGHCVEISLDSPRAVHPIQYWQLEVGGPVDLPFGEAAARLRELFLESVRMHLRSDVPVGAALSGGIDSSAIVAMMRLLEPDLEIHTFSYTVDDPVVGEERWVDIAAGATGVIVHKTRPTSEELVADLDRLIRVQDEPFGSTSIYAQHRVFRLAEEAGIKVMLDGQGADELLAGYSSYFVPRLASLLRRGRLIEASTFVRSLVSRPRISAKATLRSACGSLMPELMRQPMRRVVRRNGTPEWLNMGWLLEREVASSTPPQPAGRLTLQRQLRDSVRDSLPALLRFEDRNSMAHSIESRVPFLTPQLAEFILSLPDEYIIARDGTTKHVFRQAMRGIVPDPILDRRDKVGFETPEQRWLAVLKPWVDEVFAGAAPAEIPVLNLPAVRAEWEGVLTGKRPFDWRVWRWINLIRWSELHSVQFA